MPDDPPPLTADALTLDLLTNRLRDVAVEAPSPPEARAVEALLTRYVRAHQAAGRVRVARALGLTVDDDDTDTDVLALHLMEAVQALPEFRHAAPCSSPVSAPEGDEAPDAQAPDDAPPEGPAVLHDEGERIVVNEVLRAHLDARAQVLLFGGVPVPKTLAWLRSALRADVVWISSDDMPRAPLFDSTRDAAVVLLQGLLGHGDMDKLVAAARRDRVPFARANMPGRGELRRAIEIIDRVRWDARA